jgi:hypothetical protein
MKVSLHVSLALRRLLVAAFEQGKPEANLCEAGGDANAWLLSNAN